MSQYLDAFFSACREWCDRSGNGEHNITGPLMVYTGGHGNYPRVGESDRDAIGYHTLDQLRDWFQRIIDQTGMLDIFLVLAAVKATESDLVSQVENYGGEKRHYRAMQAEYLDLIEQKGLIGEEADQVRRVAESLQPQTVGSLEELKKRRDALTGWRDLMNPVLARTRFREL